MKLHRIELENLNSLYGQHNVDLSQDLRDAPIFLIMGPTGSGKSTLLDAICLALFGQTPRLSRVRGREETDSRMIMSQGTGHCVASVLFSKILPDGGRDFFRATWECNRARQRPDGNFQDPVRTLERVDAQGEVLELVVSDKRSKYTDGPFSEALEGLTVEDFKRSMILAQGDFAAFLKATDRDKASILERLTDTAVYKNIGAQAADQMRVARDAYRDVQARAEALDMLTPEQVEELMTRQEELGAKSEGLKAEVEQARTHLTWLDQLAGLQAQALSAAEQAEQARANLDASADDIERLERDQRSRPVLVLREQLDQRQEETDALVAKLDQAREQARTLALDVPRWAHKEIAARDALEDIEASVRDLRPLVQQALLTEQALAREEAAAASFELQLGEMNTRLDTARNAHAARQQEATQAQGQLTGCEEALAALAPLRPLVEHIGAFEARRDAIAAGFKRADQLAERHSADAKRVAELTTEADALRARLSAADGKVAPLTEARDQAQAELEAALGEHSDPEARREQLKTRIHELDGVLRALDDALRISQELRELRGQRIDFGDDADRAETSLLAVRTQIAEVNVQIGDLGDQAERLRDNLQDVKLALNLTNERDRLNDGHPCPLCGSHDHPYAGAERIHELDRQLRERHNTLQSEVTALDAQRQGLVERQTDLRTQEARLETALKAKQDRLQEVEDRRVRLTNQLADRLAEADLTSATDDQTIHAEQAKLRALLTQVRLDEQRLDRAHTQVRAADDKLAAHRAETEQLRSDLHALDARIQDQQAALTAALADADAARAAAQESLGGLMGDLKPFPLELPEPPTLDALPGAFERARGLIAQLHDAQTKRDAAHNVVQTAQQQLQLAQERFEQAERDHAQLVEQRDAHVAKLDQLRRDHSLAQSELRSRLDDPSHMDDLSSFQQSLDDRLSAARQRLDDAQTRSQEIRQELDRAELLQHERQDRLDSLHTEVRQLRNDVTARIRKLGLDPNTTTTEDLAELVLDEHARKTIQDTLDALRQKIDTTNAQRTLVAEQIATHQAQRPATLDPEQTDGDALRDQLADLDQASQDALRDLLRVQETLDQHHALAQRFEALNAELEARRGDYQVAAELHKLIGVNDGDSFRQFAQILNLQELIDKANIHLRWLAPRYTLTIRRDKDDQPILDFAVRDVHYANTERPLTTLSGGETFLVSLALALGLADFRTIDMPIETLLMDEGLGTLDSESLGVVMGALERLHNSGTQIGIISHVSSLREAVQARVVLEPQGAGRSSIRIDLSEA